jgi:methyl-accepting chemotaxis protein
VRGRHRAAPWIAGVAMALGVTYAVARDMETPHVLGYAGSGLLLLGIGSVARFGTVGRGSAISLALMVVASLVVHASGGATEAHLLYFLSVPVVALYAGGALPHDKRVSGVGRRGIR